MTEDGKRHRRMLMGKDQIESIGETVMMHQETKNQGLHSDHASVKKQNTLVRAAVCMANLQL